MLNGGEIYILKYCLYDLAKNESDAEETCPNCKKLFYIEGSYIPQFNTRTMEEMEEEYE